MDHRVEIARPFGSGIGEKIFLDEGDTRMIRNISVHTGREIVEDGKPVAGNQQRLGNMRADKSCAACDKNVHFRFERVDRNVRGKGMEPLPVKVKSNRRVKPVDDV